MQSGNGLRLRAIYTLVLSASVLTPFFRDASADPILDEFLAIADAFDASGHPNSLSRTGITDAEQRLAELNDLLTAPPVRITAKAGDDIQVSVTQLTNEKQSYTLEKINVLSSLAMRHLNLGEFPQAVAAADEASELSNLEYVSAAERANVEVVRGTVYLRLAETENCVNRNNAECCVFPLSGGGVHQSKEAAEQARASFLRVLANKPDDTRSKWLLNILDMALGTYPGSVDPAYRIPPTAFTPDYDIGLFPNVAKSAGVDTFGLAGGVVTFDYDRDGYLDLAASSWGTRDPLKLYRNKGDGTFEDKSDFSGVSNQLGGLQINSTDYNNDGYEDLYIMRGAWYGDLGQMRNSLLRNNGDGTFTDVTYGAGLALPAYPTQATAWADFDNDGNMDLFVANEGWPGWMESPCQLFKNNGDGTFTDVAPQAGVGIIAYVKGIAVGDYDNDRDMDVFLSTGYSLSILFRNNGNMTFSEVASSAGVSDMGTFNYEASMDFPSWFFDYDNDGWLDLFIVPFATTANNVFNEYMGISQSFRKPRLYRNNGNGTFTNKAAELDLQHPYETMGASFGDLDNDGWLDIYLTTGDPSYTALVPNVMLRNDRGLVYQDVTFSGGFGNLQKGHGVSFADYNNDGTQEIYNVLGGSFESDRYFNTLYANPGFGNRFLHISLVGTSSNRIGYGVRIKVTVTTPSGTRDIHRAVGSISSFGHTPSRAEIGLGDATAIQQVDIWWPKTDQHQVLSGVPLDAWIEVTEGQAGFAQKPLQPFSFDVATGAKSTGFLKVAQP